mgnify:CR=1 FL=1
MLLLWIPFAIWAHKPVSDTSRSRQPDISSCGPHREVGVEVYMEYKRLEKERDVDTYIDVLFVLIRGTVVL